VLHRRHTSSMKRRILLVDDEVAVLLTLKAVLEISGFDVDTATSAREGKSRIRHREYEMVITDMRMEEELAGAEVIAAAKEAPYSPAIALLTAFPVDDEALSTMGADKMLVKPMHTRILLQQLEALFARHTAAKQKSTTARPVKSAAKKSAAVVKKVAAVAKKAAPVKKAAPAKKAVAKKVVAVKKVVAAKKVVAKAPAKKIAVKKAVPAKKAVKKAAKKSR
jgi:DNA-binding response OmpR family regulator